MPDAQLARTDTGELVRRVQAGDTRAFEIFVHGSIAAVRRAVASIVRNVDDAEEIVFDSYRQLWSSVDRFAGERGTLCAWLIVIARSRAIDFVRSPVARMQRVALEVAERADDRSSTGAATWPDRVLEQDEACRALLRLSDPQRRLIELAYLWGHSHEEIAAKTGLALGTVKSHIRRGLVALKTGAGGRPVPALATIAA